ncbi:MAG: glycosyltransferase family 2 protein [Candidatus Neomarinimicrobiota bacterium]
MSEIRKSTPRISAVIPVYNERDSVAELIEELVSVLEDGYDYELIFVDDGSTDGSLERLQEGVRSHENLTVIRFLRNHGKSAALSAGFQRASGEFIVTLDADLQDDPHEIPRLVKLLEDGYDLVSGWKKHRQDPVFRRLSSKFFNFSTRVVTGIKIHDFNCGLKAYRKNVAKELDIYGGMHRYIPVLAAKKGFRVREAVVNHRPRKFGATKYGAERYFHGLFDLLTVLFLSRYTRRPLHLFGIFGLLSFLVGFGVNLWVLYLKYGVGDPFRKHMALLVFGVLLLILGVQFVSIGLLGEMIAQSRTRGGKIIQEVMDKDSPRM